MSAGTEQLQRLTDMVQALLLRASRDTTTTTTTSHYFNNYDGSPHKLTSLEKHDSWGVSVTGAGARTAPSTPARRIRADSVDIARQSQEMMERRHVEEHKRQRALAATHKRITDMVSLFSDWVWFWIGCLLTCIQTNRLKTCTSGSKAAETQSSVRSWSQTILRRSHTAEQMENCHCTDSALLATQKLTLERERATEFAEWHERYMLIASSFGILFVQALHARLLTLEWLEQGARKWAQRSGRARTVLVQPPRGQCRAACLHQRPTS